MAHSFSFPISPPGTFASLAVVAITTMVVALVLRLRRRAAPASSQKQLLSACRAGRAEEIAALLAAHPDLAEAPPPEALLLAASSGCEAAALALPLLPSLAQAATVPEGLTVLHLAADKGLVELTRRVLDNNLLAADVTNAGGESPLFFACARGHEALADVLLDTTHRPGADPARASKTGKTPLHFAAHANQPDLLARLAHAMPSSAALAAAVAAVDRAGYTPLHAAVLGGAFEAAARLVSAPFNANVNAITSSGATPLATACRQGGGASPALVRLLLGAGADPLAADTFGTTALHHACATSRADVCRALLEQAPALLAAQDNDGLFPIHSVCQTAKRAKHQQEEVEQEPEAGAAGASEVLEVLLEFGASPDAADYGDATPISHLCSATAPQPPGPLVVAGEAVPATAASAVPATATSDGECCTTVLELARRLVASGADVCRENCQGWMPLHVLLNNRSFCTRAEHRAELEGVLRAAMAKQRPDVLDAFSATKPRGSNAAYLARRGPQNRVPLEDRRQLLQGDFSMAGIAAYLQRLVAARPPSAPPPKVLVLTGAGVSTSCGIPDFRSRTGLYRNAATASTFQAQTLLERPHEFYAMVKTMFLPVHRGDITPGACHRLVAALAQAGMLARLYTQNIDGLDRRAGVPSELIVEAHGTMDSAHCLACGREADMAAFWADLEAAQILPAEAEAEAEGEETAGEARAAPPRLDRVPRCREPGCCDKVSKLPGLLAPDVVFFGMPLPPAFFQTRAEDLKTADLLLVMGTSLLVYPFAGLASELPIMTPRLLLNAEPAGPFRDLPVIEHVGVVSADRKASAEPLHSSSSPPDPALQYRDVCAIGELDVLATRFADLLRLPLDK